MRVILQMDFPERLNVLRKQENYTQQQLADAIGIHVSQLKRYEAGTSQPTLNVLKKLTIELGISADTLLFDKDERNPSEDLRLQFEMVSRMPEQEKYIVRALLEGMIFKYQNKQMTANMTT
jgi:transcriptional regulator with XRE-family HTH domain